MRKVRKIKLKLSSALPSDWTINEEWVVRDGKGQLRGVSREQIVAEYMAYKSFALPRHNPNKV